MASEEPRASSQPTRNTRPMTASAIASVSHLKTLSPSRDGGGMRSIVDPGAWLLGSATIVIVILRLDLFDAFEHALTHCGRQRRVIELFRHVLAFAQRPLQKLDQLFAFGCIFLLLINEQPCRARDRV